MIGKSDHGRVRSSNDASAESGRTTFQTFGNDPQTRVDRFCFVVTIECLVVIQLFNRDQDLTNVQAHNVEACSGTPDAQEGVQMLNEHLGLTREK